MILYPRDPELSLEPDGLTAAWEAVELTQTAPAQQWWLIAQPDHAALAGELAARAESALLPKMDERVLKAITLHDAGWAPYDGGHPEGTGRRERAYPAPAIGSDSRPVSFLDVAVEQSVAAWAGSIEKALEQSDLAGRLVSEHFSRIAQLGISRSRSSHEQAVLNAFMDGEVTRQGELQRHLSYSREQASALVDVLQFFDLLSLYACCGSCRDVEFPQRIQGRPVRLINEKGRPARLEPKIFPHTVEVDIAAWGYSTGNATSGETRLPVVFA